MSYDAELWSPKRGSGRGLRGREGACLRAVKVHSTSALAVMKVVVMRLRRNAI